MTDDAEQIRTLLAELDHAILQVLPKSSDIPVLLALSGGLDSMVLLDRLVQVASHHPIQALHVHHGLQAAADDFAALCRDVCQRYDVPCHVLKVQIADPTTNIEAQARAARYQAFASQMTAGAVLLTAHQADDQLETLLLALKRGSGLAGLAGIAPQRAFATGWLKRPWLAFSRQQLEAVASARQLRWLEDPTNQDLSFDRNFIRHQVIRPLTDRFPAMLSTASRSIRHLQTAFVAQQQMTAQQLAPMLDEPTGQRWRQLGMPLACAPLRLDSWQQLDAAEQRELLYHYLRLAGASAEQTILQQMQRQLLEATTDAKPSWFLQEWVFRRYGHWLVAEKAPMSAVATASEQPYVWNPLLQPNCQWQGFEFTQTPDPLFHWHALTVARAPYLLSCGSLNRRLKPVGEVHHKALKDWCKLWQLPYWRRPLLPVLASLSAPEQLLAMVGQPESVQAESIQTQASPQGQQIWYRWVGAETC